DGLLGRARAGHRDLACRPGDAEGGGGGGGPFRRPALSPHDDHRPRHLWRRGAALHRRPAADSDERRPALHRGQLCRRRRHRPPDVRRKPRRAEAGGDRADLRRRPAARQRPRL
ncbi:MAG: Permease of the drug/metabolite transporter (DMT) superfamily, partial [uncultured Craurococcus sp.]